MIGELGFIFRLWLLDLIFYYQGEVGLKYMDILVQKLNLISKMSLETLD